ncbi:MAG: hypothetical protein IJN12_03855 [Clostridia bacterium]|nr:hypothetical protein [Clostridia bacterium]
MTKEALFESMSAIEDELLEKSERKAFNWKKFAVAAACVCLVTAAAVAVIPKLMGETSVPPIINIEDLPPIVPTDPGSPDTPVSPEEPLLPEYLFDAIYNDADSIISSSFLVNIPGYFTEELNESEIKSLGLVFETEWINFTGHAGFDQDGNLLEVRMSTPTRVPEVEIYVGFSEVFPTYDYVYSTEVQTSTVGNVEVSMYRWSQEDVIYLDARAVIDGVNVYFHAEATSENEAEVKKDFESIIYLYVNWFDSDGLDGIKAEYIPEYKNESLTLSEAYNDADFGLYMPKELPDGFAEESVRRYKNYQLNYLSGLWTEGYSQISWRVSYLSAEDESRFTTVEAVENYDLSLYPIPMAESVPEELREIVNDPIFNIEDLTLDVVYARSRNMEDENDVSGYRTSFDVRIGDVVIRISTKGVSPEWIYNSLKELVR